jgi:anti-anti-sigma factor
MMPQIQISERRFGDVTVLALAGRLVLGEGDGPLRERIEALVGDARIDIVLNVHDVTYVDSCGIGALIAKYVTLRQHGGNLKLVCPTDRCRRLLAITHLLPLFEVYESEEAAVRSFAHSGQVPCHTNIKG